MDECEFIGRFFPATMYIATNKHTRTHNFPSHMFHTVAANSGIICAASAANFQYEYKSVAICDLRTKSVSFAHACAADSLNRGACNSTFNVIYYHVECIIDSNWLDFNITNIRNQWLWSIANEILLFLLSLAQDSKQKIRENLSFHREKIVQRWKC